MRSIALRLRGRQFYRRSPVAAELSLMLLVLVATTMWQALVVRVYGPLVDAVPSWPDAPFVFGGLLAYGLGAGVVAVVYARARGVEIPVGRPARGSLASVALAAFAPPALVAGAVLAGDAAGVTARSMTQSSYGVSVSPFFLARVVVVPAVLAGVGLALLFHGAVQGTLRELVAPDHAAALTALAAALYYLFDAPSVRDPATLIVFLLGSAVLVSVGYAAGLLYRDAVGGSVRDAFDDPGAVPVAAVAALGALALLGNVDGLSDAVHLCLRVAVVGVAAHAYERTRSVWVPALALAAFRVSMGVAAYVESVPGAVGLGL